MKSKNILFQLLIVSLVVCITLISIGNVYAIDADPDTQISDVSNDFTSDENNDGAVPPTSGSEDNPSAQEPEWTDVSGVTFTITQSENSFSSYYLKINGLQKKENHEYLAVFANTPTLDTSAIIADPYNYTDISLLSTGDLFNLPLDQYLEKNSDIYVWFFDHVNSYDYSVTTKELISAKKLERPAQRSIGLRLQAYFFADHTAIFDYDYQISEGRKIHVKIGNITNAEILTAIRDGKSGSFASLLNYAKSAQPFYDTTFTLNDNANPDLPAIAPNLPIVDKGFYYVYMYLEDEGGIYYPLEDVGLYQALVDESIGKNLHDYYTQKDNFDWSALTTGTPDSEPTPDQPSNSNDNTTAQVKIPDAGKGILIIGFIVIISIGAFSYLNSQKYKEIK